MGVLLFILHNQLNSIEACLIEYLSLIDKSSVSNELSSTTVDVSEYASSSNPSYNAIFELHTYTYLYHFFDMLHKAIQQVHLLMDLSYNDISVFVVGQVAGMDYASTLNVSSNHWVCKHIGGHWRIEHIVSCSPG